MLAGGRTSAAALRLSKSTVALTRDVEVDLAARPTSIFSRSGATPRRSNCIIVLRRSAYASAAAPSNSVGSAATIIVNVTMCCTVAPGGKGGGVFARLALLDDGIAIGDHVGELGEM